MAAKMKARIQARGPDGRGAGALQLVLLLLTVCIGLAFVQPARAADTGAMTAGNIEATNGWSNFTVPSLSSASGSLAASPNGTGEGIVSQFAFGVSAGARIDGIQVHVKGQSDKNNQTSIFGVELSGDGGTTWTSTGYTGTFTDSSPQEDVYLGGSSLDWGWASAGWDGDNFSDTPGSNQFRLKIWNTNTGGADPDVELLEVTVWYTSAQFTQFKFRGRNDNGNETAATWKELADTNWTQKVDENFRVRFVVQETAGVSAADKTFQLEYNRNGGGWNDVNAASSVVRSWASPNVADGANTTQQVGSGTFVTPNAGFDEVDGLADPQRGRCQ